MITLQYLAPENSTADSLWLGIVIINFILPVLGISPLLIGLIREKTIVSKILSSRLLVLLGNSSYSFYLLHLGIFQSFLSNKLHFGPLSGFIILIILGIFCYLLIEQPVMKYLRRKQFESDPIT